MIGFPKSGHIYGHTENIANNYFINYKTDYEHKLMN